MTLSAPAAASLRPSRSSRSPQRTSAPGGLSAAGELAGRGRPTNLCPALRSSGMTAEPMCPDAPVTNARMKRPPGAQVPSPLRLGGHRDVSNCYHRTTPMTVTVIMGYDHDVSRWEPNARGRLERAALELYGECGFESTTVAQIAERAGLTERTFFRPFADKRQVLFAGASALQDFLTSKVDDAPAAWAPMAAIAAALVEAADGVFEERRAFAQQRH